MNYFIVILFLLIPVQSYAWIINADFESGTHGEKADGVDGFSEAFANTFYTNKHVHGGNMAAVTSIKYGESSYGTYGGSFTFPTELKQGDELWYRAWIYLPIGFPFNVLTAKVSTEGTKLMRIHTKSATAAEGYHHIYMHGTDSTKGKVFVGSEVNPDTFWGYPISKFRDIPGSPDVVTGFWGAYEMYIKFSGIPGQGIYRVWQNGQLIFEDTTTATLKSSTSTADFAYLWSYWAFQADATNYMDDVIITNEIPGNKDAHGNQFIGVGNATFLSPPRPPARVTGQ